MNGCWVCIEAGGHNGTCENRGAQRDYSSAKGGTRDREREEGRDKKNNESADEGCDKIEAGGHNGTCENRGAQRDYTSAKGGTRDREREEDHDETEIESAEEGCDKMFSCALARCAGPSLFLDRIQTEESRTFHRMHISV